MARGNNKLTIEVVRERLAARGLTLLNEEYHGRDSSITVRCANDHERTVIASSLLNTNRAQASSRCPFCEKTNRHGGFRYTSRTKITILYYTGHSWLDTEVKDTTTTTELNEKYGRGNWRLA
jgi:hypothetical protein